MSKQSAISYQQLNPPIPPLAKGGKGGFEAGFTLVELLITMTVFVLVIAAASNIFSGLLTQFKQQSKITETNIEGVVGLDIMRRDIEHAGYGLPWNVTGVADWNSLASYSEAADDSSRTPNPKLYNDGNPASALPTPANQRRAPRAILSGNDAGLNLSADAGSSDYLVVKATNVATNVTAQKWTHLRSGDGKTTWSPDCENVNKNADCSTKDTVYVTVVSPGSTTANSRALVVYNNVLFTQYNSTANYAPTDATETRVIYGVDRDTELRMPFNRADYYISRPSTNMPSRCAPNTGVLYKSVVTQGTGSVGAPNELPLLDCVADMQVVYRSDTNADGVIETTTNDISTLTAQQIREQVKEVRVYVLAHEGQKDANYTHSPTTIYVGDSLIGSGRNFEIGINVNYRWKVYTLVVKPKNLE